MKIKLILLLGLFGIIGICAWFALSPSGPPDSVIQKWWNERHLMVQSVAATKAFPKNELVSIQRAKSFVSQGGDQSIAPKDTRTYPIRIHYREKDTGWQTFWDFDFWQNAFGDWCYAFQQTRSGESITFWNTLKARESHNSNSTPTP